MLQVSVDVDICLSVSTDIAATESLWFLKGVQGNELINSVKLTYD